MNDNRKLRIILDTNILLVSISDKSEYYWIFEKLIGEEFDLFISNDILSEYEEILDRKANPKAKSFIIDLLLTADNVHKIFTYFNRNLISADPNDNKFVDCAVAGNVDYIVTNDAHFNILKEIKFPKINVLNVEEFRKIFN